MPADSAEAQQQWPYALSLVAAEAVQYAKTHLDRWVGGVAVELQLVERLVRWLLTKVCAGPHDAPTRHLALCSSHAAGRRSILVHTCSHQHANKHRLPEAVLKGLAHRGEGQEEDSRQQQQRQGRSSGRVACDDPAAIKTARMRQGLLVLMVSYCVLC